MPVPDYPLQDFDKNGENILNKLSEWVSTKGQSPCLFYGEQNKTLSYQQFNSLCNQTANGLIKLGVTKGDRVSVLSNNAFVSSVLMFSSWKLGALYCPINNRYSGELLAYILNDTQPKVLVTDQAFIDEINAIKDQLDGHIKRVIHQPKPGDHDYHKANTSLMINDGVALEYLQDNSDAEPGITLKETDLACIIYTSGTTGNPKGVVQTHKWMRACCYVYTCHGFFSHNPAIVYSDLPLYHVGGAIFNVVFAIWTGGQLALWDSFSPNEFWGRIRKSGATFARFIDVMMDWLMQAPPSPMDRDNSLSTIGMTPLPSYHQAFAERFGIDFVVVGYGSSELGVGFFSVIDELCDGSDASTDRASWKREFREAFRRIDSQSVIDGKTLIKEGYLGVLNPLMSVRVLDEKGSPVAPGVPGQAAFKPEYPDIIFREYLNKPEATHGAMNDGWYFPPDILRHDEEGRYCFVSRKQGFIRVRGENIATDAIEVQLDKHEAVERSAVIGIPAEQGAGDDVVAFIQCKDSIELADQLTLADFTAWVQAHLPKFMQPRHIRFVEEFPVTATFKIEKYKLKEMILRDLAGRDVSVSQSGKSERYPVFDKILIANRGEIAVRIINACRNLGISTVALYTDADRSWLPRKLADEAVYIGTGAAAESYIDFDKVIDAAKRTGADAIHPGYGFLAENADFARRCQQEGFVFIGPSADTIELMGNKAKAKSLVTSLDIPVIPGIDASELTDQQLTDAVNAMGYPIMLKAVAGGGGMGIRIVEKETDLPDALSSVRHEAKASFGDDRLLIEKYFPSVRHIEVQVLADSVGNAVHCYERECSVQRRRQKVIEEAPSPYISENLRTQLCEASLNIVKATAYQGLGTVEFVVVDNVEEKCFYFLEMNTRLQVEHGVTEAVTGLDLVSLQIEVAEGQSLSLQQSDIHLQGHAIECRLCAESPANNFQPVTGIIAEWNTPQTRDVLNDEEGLIQSYPSHIRIDTGITAGTEISVYYDSLIAKLIATGNTREQTLRRMQSVLKQTCLLGLETNQQFLSRILSHPTFIHSQANTTFIEQQLATLLPSLPQTICDELAIIGALACAQEDTQYLARGQSGTFTRCYDLMLGDRPLSAKLQCFGHPRYQVATVGSTYDIYIAGEGNKRRVAIDGIEKCYQIHNYKNQLSIYIPGAGSFVLAQAASQVDKSENKNSNRYTANMAGQVIAILAKAGESINTGDPLIIIESMKMEHRILAQSTGVIESVNVLEGASVKMGETLITLADSNVDEFDNHKSDVDALAVNKAPDSSAVEV